MPQLANVVGVPAGLTFSTVFYISLLFTFTDSFRRRDRRNARTPTSQQHRRR